MLINRNDTCRCTLLPNGHAPRNMHRILLFPPLPPCPPLHSCCGLWTRHPALPQTARGVYTSFTWNERQRFCNFFREREKKKRTSWKCRTDGRDLPNKVVNYTWLDESTPFPSLTLWFAQSSADNKATPVGEREKALRNCPFMTCPREETINQSLAWTPSPTGNSLSFCSLCPSSSTHCHCLLQVACVALGKRFADKTLRKHTKKRTNIA